MTFTYTPSATPSDTTRVRFHTAQTVEAESFVSDEEIAMLIAEGGGWQPAVIAVLQLIILKLSQPDFTADWLKVSSAEARKGYEGRLADKRREFGLSGMVGRAQSVRRSDRSTAPLLNVTTFPFDDWDEE